MAQSGVLQAYRIQLIRGLVRTMTMPTSPPTDPVSLPQVSSTAGRPFRWATDTNGPDWWLACDWSVAEGMIRFSRMSIREAGMAAVAITRTELSAAYLRRQAARTRD